MVKNTGKTSRIDDLKPVNLPEPIDVEKNEEGVPIALKTRRRQAIVAIEDRWRIDDEWWRNEPVSRLYYSVRLASGQKQVLFENLINNGWYSQPY